MMADLLPENDYVARIAGLTLSFPSQNGPAVIVDGVSLNFQKGRVLALVGQSGSGKSLFARSLVNLLPRGASCSAEAYEFAGRHFSGLPPARYADDVAAPHAHLPAPRRLPGCGLRRGGRRH